MTAVVPVAAAGFRPRVGWGQFEAAAVAALYDDYAALLDAGEYREWLELFVAEATYMVVSRENVERGLPLATIRCDSRAMLTDRVDAIIGTQFFDRRITRHMITAVRPVSLDAATLGTTANFVCVETLVDEHSMIHSAGSYDDCIVAVEGILRFSSKIAIYDAPLVPTSLIVPL